MDSRCVYVWQGNGISLTLLAAHSLKPVLLPRKLPNANTEPGYYGQASRMEKKFFRPLNSLCIGGVIMDTFGGWVSCEKVQWVIHIGRCCSL